MKIMCDDFHLLTHSGCTWVYSGICNNSLREKALSDPFWRKCNTWLLGSSRIWSSLYLFLLHKKSVVCLFWSQWCSRGWYRDLYKWSSYRMSRLDMFKTFLMPWWSGYHYCTTSFNLGSNSGSALVQTLLAACQRFTVLRITDNGICWQ